jgi:hypothetical protein
MIAVTMVLILELARRDAGGRQEFDGENLFALRDLSGPTRLGREGNAFRFANLFPLRALFS